MADLELLMSQELFLQDEELDEDFFDDPEVIDQMNSIDLNKLKSEPEPDSKPSNKDEDEEPENVPLPLEKDYQFTQSNGVTVQFKYSEDYEFLTLESKSNLDKLFLCVSATAVPRRVWISHQIHQLISSLTPDEAIAYVFPLILKLCNDPAITEKLALILPAYFQTGTDKGIDTESFFSLLDSTLFSSDNSVVDAATESIITFLLQVDIDIFQRKLLPVIVQLLLAPDSIRHLVPKDNVKIRTRTLRVLKSVVTRLCKQTLDEILLPIVENLYSEPSFDVRIEIIGLIDSLIPNLSLKTVENRLWPSLSELTNDKIYQVRLECISSLLLLFVNHTSSSLIDTWILTVTKLSDDRSSKVKQGIQANLGKIIYYASEHKEAENLLKKYWASCHSNQVDVRIGCAQTLPAVINRFGKSHWIHIQPALEKFIKDKEIDVVLPIAAAFHHLPQFIHPRGIDPYYLTLLKSFLKHSDRKVQLILLLNTHQLLSALPAEHISGLLPDLVERMSDLLFVTPPTSYGDRQIRETLIEFPTFSIVAELLAKLMRVVKGDYPHFIKIEAITTIATLYRQTTDPSCSISSLSVLLMDQIVALIDATSYRLRCLFVTLCRLILLPDTCPESLDADDRLLLPNLGKLCNDPTVEVRILVVKLLKDIYIIEQVETLNRKNSIVSTEENIEITTVNLPTTPQPATTRGEPDLAVNQVFSAEIDSDSPQSDTTSLQVNHQFVNPTKTSMRAQLLLDLKSKFINETNPEILKILEVIANS